MLWRQAPAEDLSALYLAARLMGEHVAPAVIYAHEPTFFHDLTDPTWLAEARATGYSGTIHPYVHSPLIAWLLAPLAGAVTFATAKAALLLVNLSCVACALFLAARMWCPRLSDPAPFALILILTMTSEPFIAAVCIGQTQPIVVFLLIAGFALAGAGKARLAGVLVALGTLIKVTPVLLVLGFLASGRYRTAGSAVLTMVLASLIGVVVIGRPYFQSYLEVLSAASRHLIPYGNNQSFITWVALTSGRGVLPAIGNDWPRIATPLALVNLAALSILCVALCLKARGASSLEADRIAGLGLILVGFLFSQIAWASYFVILPVAAIGLLGRSEVPRLADLFVVLVVYVLNIPQVVFAVYGTQLFSALLLLVALLASPTSSARTAGPSGVTGSA